MTTRQTPLTPVAKVPPFSSSNADASPIASAATVVQPPIVVGGGFSRHFNRTVGNPFTPPPGQQQQRIEQTQPPPNPPVRVAVPPSPPPAVLAATSTPHQVPRTLIFTPNPAAQQQRPQQQRVASIPSSQVGRSSQVIVVKPTSSSPPQAPPTIVPPPPVPVAAATTATARAQTVPLRPQVVVPAAQRQQQQQHEVPKKEQQIPATAPVVVVKREPEVKASPQPPLRQQIDCVAGQLEQIRHDSGVKHKMLQEEIEQLRKQLQEKEGAVSNLRDSLSAAKFQSDQEKTRLQGQVDKLQSQLRQEQERALTQEEVLKKGLNTQLAFKEKELTDLRQERDKLEVLVRSSQLLPTSDQQQSTTRLLPLAYIGPQVAAAAPVPSACAGTPASAQPKRQLVSGEVPPPKRTHSSTDTQPVQPMAISPSPNASSVFLVRIAIRPALASSPDDFLQRTRLCRKLLQLGALALAAFEPALGDVAQSSSPAAVSDDETEGTFFSILSCVLDGSVSCGALLPILDSLVSFRVSEQAVPQKDLRLAEQACVTAEVLMGSCPRCKTAMLSAAAAFEQSGCLPSHHPRVESLRVRHSGVVAQTPQSIAPNAERRQPVDTTHPRTMLLVKVVERAPDLVKIDHLARPVLRLLHCALSDCPTAFMLQCEPLLKGTFQSLLSPERKLPPQVRELALDVLYILLRGCRAKPLVRGEKDSAIDPKTVLDHVRLLLHSEQYGPPEKVRRLRRRAVSCLVVAISGRISFPDRQATQQVQLPPPPTAQTTAPSAVPLPPSADHSPRFSEALEFDFGWLLEGAVFLLDRELDLILTSPAAEGTESEAIGLIRGTSDLICFAGIDDEAASSAGISVTDCAQFQGVVTKLMRLTAVLGSSAISSEIRPRVDKLVSFCASQLSQTPAASSLQVQLQQQQQQQQQQAYGLKSND